MLLAVLLGVGAAAQDDEVLRAACYLSGAASAEEVPAEWVEFVESLQGRRLRVNAKGLRPGLLSSYQIACIADYRATSGDILSWEELALVDGFSREAVAALRPFLSLESFSGIQADSARLSATAFVRRTLKQLGGKAKLSYGGLRLGGTLREEATWYGEYSGPRVRLLLGHYNVRMAQGLAFWSGFSMDQLSTVDAFIRRSSGVTPAWSWSPDGLYRGAACEYGSRHWTASVFGDLPGKKLGGHVQYQGRQGSLGLTAGTEAISLDGRLNHRGTDWAGELAWKNRSLAGKAALSSRLTDRFRLAMQARIIPSRFSGKKYGEYALAAGGAWKSRKHNASLTTDLSLLPLPGSTGNPFSRTQVRVYAFWTWQASPGWSLQLRATERYRNYERPRTALRAQAGYASALGSGTWTSTLRAESVFCEKTGLLAYGESGLKFPGGSAFYLRATAFHAPRWNDRIYVYERDAPGSFSVPAYYGRGAALSCYAALAYRPRPRLRLLSRLCLKANLRAACTWRSGSAPSPALKLQLQCSL